jgi:hypothetical protein
MSRLQIFPLLLQLDPIRPNGPSYHLRNLCPLTALDLILLISPFSFASSRNQRIIGPRRKSFARLTVAAQSLRDSRRYRKFLLLYECVG